MAEDLHRWLEELRTDWRDLRKEVIEVLRWQAETRPKCDIHDRQNADYESRLRKIEKLQQEATGGLSVGVKAILFGGWVLTTGLALAAILLK